jgi:hypothetical protein
MSTFSFLISSWTPVRICSGRFPVSHWLDIISDFNGGGSGSRCHRRAVIGFPHLNGKRRNRQCWHDKNSNRSSELQNSGSIIVLRKNIVLSDQYRLRLLDWQYWTFDIPITIEPS